MPFRLKMCYSSPRVIMLFEESISNIILQVHVAGYLSFHEEFVATIKRIWPLLWSIDRFSYVMMASSNGKALRTISPVPGEFPAQRPVTRSFDVFFDLRLNERLCKQSWGCWFETPSRSLQWRHNVLYLSHLCLFSQLLLASVNVCYLSVVSVLK